MAAFDMNDPEAVVSPGKDTLTEPAPRSIWDFKIHFEMAGHYSTLYAEPKQKILEL